MVLPFLVFALAARGPVVPAAQGDVNEVPFDIDVSTIVVPATVNGKELRLIFDTGFSGEVVVDDTIDMGKQSGTVTLQDFVGTFEAKTYKVKTLKLGGKSINGSDLTVIGQPGASEFGNSTHVDGLMGYSVIKNYITEINFQNKKFIFHPSTEDLSLRKPDNKKTFLVQMQPLGNRSIELLVKTGTGKSMTLALDTGNAFYATTHRDVLERVGLWTAGQEPKFQQLSGVASGTVTSWYKVLKDMTIFGVPVPVSIWDIIDRPASSSESDGTVGFGFLKNFNITMDYTHRLVWLENFTGKVADDPEGNLGISAFYVKELNSVEIFRVAPDSPADKAGIKKGDLLLDVDDNELTNIAESKLRNLLEGPVDSKVKMTISHEGIAKRITLTRLALVN